ncbi:hypothetical protein ACJMK2_009729 [Sinanodonta woodiana]|uniref:RRM domain-containing protein n=1 Tax=Sinanodonta woodiana TaxID=1069815 RepID=A0ABD3VD72_SINWO
MGTRRKFSSHSTEETGNQENTEPVLRGKRTRTRSQRESDRETDGASPVKEVAQKPGDESHKGDERVLEERNMQEKEEHDAERQDTKTEASNREVTKDGVKSEGIEISSSGDQIRKKYVEKEDVMTKANETPMETEDAQHRKTKSVKKSDKKGKKGRSRSSSSSSRSSRSSSESPPRSKVKGRVERKRQSSRDRSESPPKSKLKVKGERKRSWSSSRSSSESPQKLKGQAQKRSRSESESPERKKTKPARRRSSSSSSSRSSSKSKEKSRSRSAESRSSSSRSRSQSQSRSPSRSPELRSPPGSRLKSQPLNTVVRDESSFHTASEDTPVKDQMCSPEQSSGMETDTVEIKSKQSDVPLAPEKEEGELPQESEPKEQKKSSRRISLTRGEKDGEKDEDKDHSQQTEGLGEKPLRKRKWGSKTASTANKPPRKATSLAISTDSLKGLISDIKPGMLNEASLDLDVKDDGGLSDQEDTRDVKIQRTVIQVVKQDADEESSSEEEEKADEEEEGENDTEEEKQEEAKKDKAEKIKPPVVEKKDGDERHDVDKENKKKKTIEERVKAEPKIIRRVSNPPLVQPDEPMKAGRGQSPARNPVSRIVHIRNLVRPFTVNQLKELMKRTGNFTDEGFWIDKIKSHCYVTYSTEEEAMATRKALHGTRWPQSNPKILMVDYGTEDEVLHHRNLEVSQAPIQKEKPVLRKEKEKEKERVKEKERERDRKKKEEKKEEVKPIREWDRDKLRQSEERERERRRARSLSRERRQHERSRDRERAKKEKKAPVVEKKVEDEPPAKLLDDLFRKTKVTPCIYWLPLTEAQISERETARKQREVERQKRREEQEKVEEAERKQRIADRAKRRETEERSRPQKDKESMEASPVKERNRNRRQNEDGPRKRVEKSRSPKNQHQRQSRSGEGRRR